MISVELKHLTHLLNDIYLPPEMAIDFDVVLLICDLVTLMRYQIANTISLEVEASQPFIVHLPENTLRLALLNLLLSAAEALENSSCGHICIKIYKLTSGLTIQVFDDGPGFSLNMLNGAAQLRIHPRYPAGLAMAQRFISKLGGSINIRNQTAHGTCVTISLPDECIVDTQ